MLWNLEQVLLFNNNFFEEWLEKLEGLAQSRMKGIVKVYLASHIISDAWNVAVLSDSRSHFIGHISCFRVTNPTVDSSSSRKHPKATFKPEVILQQICE